MFYEKLSFDSINVTANTINTEPREFTFINAERASVKNKITTSSNVTRSSYISLMNGTNLSVGGVDGQTNFASVATQAGTGTSILEFKNTTNSQSTGNIIETKNYYESMYAAYLTDYLDNSNKANAIAKIGVKMNASVEAAKQSFSSQSLFFTGGVTVANGTLAVRFNQSTKDYFYTTHFKTGAVASGSNKWTDYKRTDFTTTQNRAETDTITTASHGNLVMEGGVFENLRAEENNSSRIQVPQKKTSRAEVFFLSDNISYKT